MAQRTANDRSGHPMTGVLRQGYGTKYVTSDRSSRAAGQVDFELDFSHKFFSFLALCRATIRAPRRAARVARGTIGCSWARLLRDTARATPPSVIGSGRPPALKIA